MKNTTRHGGTQTFNPSTLGDKRQADLYKIEAHLIHIVSVESQDI